MHHVHILSTAWRWFARTETCSQLCIIDCILMLWLTEYITLWTLRNATVVAFKPGKRTWLPFHQDESAGRTWMEFGRKSDFHDWFFVGLLSSTRQMSQCFLEIVCDPFLLCCDLFMNMPAIGDRRPTVGITYSVVKWINIGNMAEIEM